MNITQLLVEVVPIQDSPKKVIIVRLYSNKLHG